MNEYYGILTSQNEMCLQDIKNECMEESWVPLCSKINNKNGDVKIIFFLCLDTARRFVRRNFGKKELVGIIKIPYFQFEQIQKNTQIEILDWPHSYKNSLDYKLGIEVINLIENPLMAINSEKI